MKQKVFRLLADLRFSIFILLLISVCSIVGTIIEQDQSIEIYKINYPLTNPVFGFLSWDRILQLGLDHVYKTWWFLGLIFLFGCSLTLCSFLQQLPSLKIARRSQFFRTTNPFSRLKLSTILNNFSFSRILARIKNQQYSIFQQKNMVYCYKGLIGRIAPIIVHFSMILILLGTIIGSLFGFKAQEIVPKTENFHIQNILTNGPSTIIPKTSARINDFWITYTKTKTISQFYSDLSILDSQGKENIRKTIYVNYPLIYKGVYYYQTDWNLIALRFQNQNQQIIEYPLLNIFGNQNKVWLSWISNNQISNDGIIIIIDNLEGYCSIYNSTGQFLGNLELNETVNFKQPLTLLEIISSTGLQIKTDPGIPMIYSGFFFLMISTLISYITYSQVWMIQKNQQIFIGGTTNRAIFEFELEFFKVVK
jgi:cytochrome c biogenesis protein|uniref:Cytochrome c biogenesis protein Ccs1 n=1 Tax=Tryblionella apiculata TaxID=1003145 RepID=A0A8F0WGQ0_9STRA|nr:c-type cytochrome biogenesis protein [Tryblionella apiculata]QWM93459.1 c-type cytochrome biogenesis protein [Tryblionella apiculata]